jgi:hypothetical protein
MALCLSRVHLLSLCLISLIDGSIPNLCSITTLGILSISNIFHAKTSRFSQRKVTNVRSYLGSSFELILNFLSESLGSAGISLLSTSSTVPFFFLSTFRSVGSWVEAKATMTLFYAVVSMDTRGVLLVSGLDTDDF